MKFIDHDIEEPSPAELEMVAGLNAMRARRHSIYWDWRPASFPLVTLKQAAWLLMGQDPIQIEHALPPYRVLRRRRFRELLNRLECAVAVNDLRSIGPRFGNFVCRFRLVDVATVALRKSLAPELAREILAIIKEKPAGRVHHEAVALQERLEDHRKFVLSLGATAMSVEPKLKKLNRRKSSINPVNCRLAMSRQDYDEAFRGFRDRQRPERAIEPVSFKMLDDDRRQLNIQLKRGRPQNENQTSGPTPPA